MSLANPFSSQPAQVPHKNHETMIRELLIHRKRFDSRLIVLNIGPLRQALSDLVVRLGLTTSVDFLEFRNVLPFFRQTEAFLPDVPL